MDPSLLSSLVSSGATFGGSAFSSMMNNKSVRETNAQNLAIQNIQWQREDKAYQRLAEDLEKAGYSKNILSGVSSGSSSSSNYRAQPMDYSDVANGLSKGVDVFLNSLDRKREREIANVQMAQMNENVKHMQEVIKGTMTDNAIKLQHLEQEKEKTIQSAYQTQALQHNIDYYNKNKFLPYGSWYGTPEMYIFVKSLEVANRINEGLEKELEDAESRKAKIEVDGLPSYVVDLKSLTVYIENELGIKYRSKGWTEAYNSLKKLLVERQRLEYKQQFDSSPFGKRWNKFINK